MTGYDQGHAKKLYSRLRCFMQGLGSVVAAYSGGADSSLVAFAATEVLGPDKALLVTAVSETYPLEEKERACVFASSISARHILLQTAELKDACFAANPRERCYFCKRELFSKLERLRQEHGFEHIADGSNLDDDDDHRPGRKAAAEFGVISPLHGSGIGKSDVRKISEMLGLATAHIPQQACLASRIPYGTEITKELLGSIEAAESIVKSAAGLEQVRARHHGEILRIEVEKHEIEKLLPPAVSDRILEGVNGLGYKYITVDLNGYRQGSMN